MASMKNDISNSRTIPVNPGEQNYNREDEINLADYLDIIHKRKYFIFLCSVLPALLFGIILFISPKNCKITYTYDVGQNKKDLNMTLDKSGNIENPNKLTAELEKDEIPARDRKILLESFFDSENLNKLAAKLKENGFEEYARELSGEKIQTGISGTLLTMTVNGDSGQDMRKISSIVRDNFETNLLTYAAKQESSNNISMLKSRIAEIEENNYNTELELDGQKTILTKLKNMASADPNNIRDGLVPHSDNAGANKAYQPRVYQVRAAEANIISIEETVRTNQKKYCHYKALIELNEKLLNDIRNNTFDNAREFHSFLINTTGNYQSTEFENYLNSYINKMENAISANTALIENPKIDFASKDIFKKSSIVFLLLLIMTMFLAFLLEAAQKNRGPVS